jgi:hypothetical protein
MSRIYIGLRDLAVGAVLLTLGIGLNLLFRYTDLDPTETAVALIYGAFFVAGLCVLAVAIRWFGVYTREQLS